MVEVKKKRENLGISQEKLAHLSGVSYRTIIRLEKGFSIRKNNLEKIIRTLEVLERSKKEKNFWWETHRISAKGSFEI